MQKVFHKIESRPDLFHISKCGKAQDIPSLLIPLLQQEKELSCVSKTRTVDFPSSDEEFASIGFGTNEERVFLIFLIYFRHENFF